MREHYAASELARTRALYGSVLEWARARDDATIIGGWAVYERVAPARAMQSRDVDVVLHSEGALLDLWSRLGDWGLAWRARARGRYFPDAHFPDEGPLVFRLDVFTTRSNPTWVQRFGMHGRRNIKDCPGGLFPPTRWLVLDKLTTVPRRDGPHKGDKRAKDLMDLHNLVFHNTTGDLPGPLVRATPAALREPARLCLDAAAKLRPEYADDYRALDAWLRG